MRLKLILLVSVGGTLIGVGSAFVVRRMLEIYWIRNQIHELVSVMVILIIAPIVVTPLVSAIFVYRRTASRRKTQSTLTAILVLMLSILVMNRFAWLFSPPAGVY